MKAKLAGLIFLGAAILSSQERFDYKVRSYFFAGFAGDTAALDKGMKISENVLASEPNNAEAMVWHGAGLFYQSGVAFRKGDQQSAADLWQRGLKEMDDAVAIAPEKLGVRIPRGATLLTASHYINDPERVRPLIEKGLSDFEKAYSVQGPDLSKLGTHPRGELMIGLADGYSRLGDQEKARAWFERIQQELKGTPYEKSANIWVETKSLAPAEAGCLSCHTGK
jgi:tetratricopeptide (TPR) repeat protein